MRVPVRDEARIRKPSPQAVGSISPRPAVVHEGDAQPAVLELEAPGKVRPQRGLVRVAVDASQGAELRELLERRDGREIARVQDQLCGSE
jgi:hypothetical protein